jgi:DNA-binding XRE family transcriptional regulator
MLSKTTDGIAILENRYVGTSKSKAKLLRQMEDDLDVAQQLYELRSNAGLSQRELAKLVGTTASVICQLEDAEYQGHSLRMLHRIAAALQHRVVIKFVPMNGK